jgi:DNA-binding CsgD family transcriptional regulator
MGPSRRAATGPGRQRIKDPARRPARLRPPAPCQATYTLEGGRPGNLTTAAATRRNCTHETRCARNSGCSTDLTSQQREIIILASRGLTNSEIADRLFLSPRTVASHLYRSYPKLGIAGRHQLRDLLDQATDRHGTPAPHS